MTTPPSRIPGRTVVRATVLLVALSAVVGVLAGCGSAGVEAAQNDEAATAGVGSDALAEAAEVLAGPEGLFEVARRLDRAMAAHLVALRACPDDVACFSEYRDEAGSAQVVRGLLESYVERVAAVVSAAVPVVGASTGEGGEAGAELGERWRAASVVAARAAASLLDCLEWMGSGDFEASMVECLYRADLFAAALGDENRLGVEFQRAYFAYLDP